MGIIRSRGGICRFQTAGLGHNRGSNAWTRSGPSPVPSLTATHQCALCLPPLPAGDLAGVLACITSGHSVHEVVSMRNQQNRVVCGVSTMACTHVQASLRCTWWQAGAAALHASRQSLCGGLLAGGSKSKRESMQQHPAGHTFCQGLAAAEAEQGGGRSPPFNSWLEGTARRECIVRTHMHGGSLVGTHAAHNLHSAQPTYPALRLPAPPTLHRSRPCSWQPRGGT